MEPACEAAAGSLIAAHPDGVAVNVRRYWSGGIGRRKAAHDGVKRASSVPDDKLQLDDGAAGAVGRSGKVDFSFSRTIWVYPVPTRFFIVKSVFILRTTNWNSVGHHPIHLTEAAISIEVSHSYTVSICSDRVAIRDKDLA